MQGIVVSLLFLCFFLVRTTAGLCVVDPLTPARLLAAATVQPLCAGYIDVTLPPYNASGDGMADDSDALQDAADDAYVSSMTVFLPGGLIFLMSRQLTLLQKFCYPPCGYTRAHGMQVVGGGGLGLARPIIRLRDNAVNVADNIFITFVAVDGDNTTIDNEASHYNSRWRGIDIDMGTNPSVSALSMSAAQMCSIEDIAVSGIDFFAGVNGLPGSGGFCVNVNVTGGAYGILQNQYRPNPSLAGLRLVGQKRAGILVVQTRGPVVVTGFHIESPLSPDPSWRAVLLNSTQASKDNAFAGEDGVFITHSSSGDGGATVAVVETGGSDVALRNVLFSPGPGNATLFAAPLSGAVVPRGGADSSMDPDWVLMSRFVFTASGGSVWDEGVNASAGHPTTAYLSPPGLQRFPNPPPPPTHTWIPDSVPTWAGGGGGRGFLDIITSYGATPAWVNATDDDGVCIQAAIDDSCNPTSLAFGKPVFLPHGEFGLYAPLDLHGCGRLVGAGSHSSWLRSLPIVPLDPSTCWDGSDEAAAMQAMLISSSGQAAAAQPPPPLLSDFGLMTRPLCPFLDLRVGADTLLRDVCVAMSIPPPGPYVSAAKSMPPPTAPYTSISGTTSGRFFGLSLDLLFGNNDGSNPPPGPSHVLLLVNGTGRLGGGGVHLYQLSTEHMPLPKSTLFVGAADVHVHAWKSESALYEPSNGGPGDTQSLVWIVDTVNVTIFGHSGNFRQFNTTVGTVDVTGSSSSIELMAMTRTYKSTEPNQGTMWVRDVSGAGAGGGVTLDGHHQISLFRSL